MAIAALGARLVDQPLALVEADSLHAYAGLACELSDRSANGHGSSDQRRTGGTMVRNQESGGSVSPRRPGASRSVKIEELASPPVRRQRADLCHSRAMLEGRCPAVSCRPRRSQRDSWIARVLATKASDSATIGSTPSQLPRAPGPAVIVIHEIPGQHPLVIRFADRIVAAGMRVFLPVLFGEPGRHARSTPHKYIFNFGPRFCAASMRRPRGRL